MDVLVVDDSEIERAGRELVLSRRGHRVVAVDWTQAHSVSWGRGVVLAVVRRDPEAFDRFERLRLAGPLHRLGAGTVRRIVLTADPTPLSPVAQLRLRRSGAVAVLPSSLVPTGDLLDELVRTERFDQLTWRPVIGRVAVGANCDPRAVVEHVLEKAVSDDAYLRAFEPGTAQNQSGLSRRRAHTLRRKVAELGDLEAMPASSGGPVRDLSLPRWNDVINFVNECRGWQSSDAPHGGRNVEPILAELA